MIIAIFPHKEKKDSYKLAKEIIKFLEKNKITVVSEDEDASLLNTKKMSSVDNKKIDFLVSLGGDGSILRLAHKYLDLEIPILGVNIGQIGFMADIPISDIYPSLQDLIIKNYKIEKRIILEAKTSSKTFYAVNEIVMHKNPNHKLIEIAIYIDGQYLSTFSSDGIILATPNGSTAYSLSAGGPILHPELEAVVLNPVCPHTISIRPIVLTSNHEIQLQYLSSHKHPIELRTDSIEYAKIKKDEIVKIKKSKKRFNLIKLNRHDYFSTLNSKLGWSGSMV